MLYVVGNISKGICQKIRYPRNSGKKCAEPLYYEREHSGACVPGNSLADSVPVIRGMTQNYVVRFKSTVVVSVLKVILDMGCESEKSGRFVPNFQINVFYPLSAVRMETF